MSVSKEDFKAFIDLATSIGELKGDLEALRAENKCLREDRDSWKQMAMANAPGKSDSHD
jgi:hypothetical protein